MPSTTSTRKSTPRWKSTLGRIRGLERQPSPREPAEEGSVIEHRYGTLNQHGDVGNGEFTDSVFRLMEHRGHLQALEAETVHESAEVFESSALRVEGQRESRQELSKKLKRKLRVDLLPGGEPIAVTLYHLLVAQVGGLSGGLLLVKRSNGASKSHCQHRSPSDS